jgi:bifunctional DNA primase/polymerase-like protein
MRVMSSLRNVTADGAAWLVSAGTYPRSTLALWEEQPDAPLVLSCGSVFDVVNAPAVFGRRMLDRLWTEGPGSGPVAVFRGRVLLFTAPGTAQRLPSLLAWEGRGSRSRVCGMPPLLCHGTGDAVTVPSLRAGDRRRSATHDHSCDGPHDDPHRSPRDDSRWLVAPDSRRPWLPGPEVALWAAVRAARESVRISIFPPAEQGAKVYDVSRRR